MTTQTAIKEQPILFSGEMVRAILDGRKTQTRRALTTQPLDVLPMNTQGQWIALTEREPEPRGTMFRCRYGQPGDRLWVRETWAVVDTAPSRLVVRFAATPQDDYVINPGAAERDKYEGGNFDSRWRPSIHMPRWASRITLEITDVRVERVQDMPLADVAREGISRPAKGESWDKTIDAFADLWDTINAKRGYSWNMNPWVWVVSFRRVQP